MRTGRNSNRAGRLIGAVALAAIVATAACDDDDDGDGMMGPDPTETFSQRPSCRAMDAVNQCRFQRRGP